MADINALISLGIGSPADKKHFLTLGLDIGTVAAIIGYELSATVDGVSSMASSVGGVTGLSVIVGGTSTLAATVGDV